MLCFTVVVTIFINLLLDNLTTLSVTQNIQSRITGWLCKMNLKGHGKKRPWPNLSYDPCI
jgi:hypothetical protein